MIGMFIMKNNYGVVFDLDGVLLDSESDLTWLYEALKKTLEYLEIETSEENLSKIHSKNVHRFNVRIHIKSQRIRLDRKKT